MSTFTGINGFRLHNSTTDYNNINPWIRIRKNINELPTAEIISRVGYRTHITNDGSGVFFLYDSTNTTTYQEGWMLGFPLFNIKPSDGWPFFDSISEGSNKKYLL